MKAKKQVANTESNHQNVPDSPSVELQIGKNGPTSDEIRWRAHEIYMERGGTDGADLEDWLQAERELWANYKSNETRPKSK